ncbi:hypothetical protein MSG28_002185 [Choristoneura fumiferana]|uniref:Uncharacterized protein n=1 Tax=Choristoneura fumiferana TaxID=7141 RepID=A0ACC0JU80_CHOFU|nr:hypothetical protein MSG28_002185 [Choristoneura fumiferana]
MAIKGVRVVGNTARQFTFMTDTHLRFLRTLVSYLVSSLVYRDTTVGTHMRHRLFGKLVNSGFTFTDITFAEWQYRKRQPPRRPTPRSMCPTCARRAPARHAVSHSFTDLGLHDKKISTGNDSFTDHGFHDKHIKVEGFIWGVAIKVACMLQHCLRASVMKKV